MRLPLLRVGTRGASKGIVALLVVVVVTISFWANVRNSAWDLITRSYKDDNAMERALVSQSPLLGITSTNRRQSNASTSPIIHESHLQYGTQLQANADKVEFHANFSISATGKACFNFVVHQSESGGGCPHPYIRLRLTGAALVHVPLKKQATDNASAPGDIHLAGCALLPVPGPYYVDANLLHCRMTVDGIPDWNLRQFKKRVGRSVMPDLTMKIIPHRFEMPPFHREAMPLREPSRNAIYSNHAWVFAPICGDDGYTVSENCTKLHSPTFIPTKFQVDEWLVNNHFDNFRSENVSQRFDNYMWLPVNPTNGVVDYTAEHFGFTYSPKPLFLQQQQPSLEDAYDADGGDQNEHNKAVMFLGDSHGRSLHNQVSEIYHDLTNRRSDGCSRFYRYRPAGLYKNLTRFRYAPVLYGDDGFNQFDTFGNHFDIIVVTIGHWDASSDRWAPSTPAAFMRGLMNLTASLEKGAKPGAQIFVTTVNPNPMGNKMLSGLDWRVPPLIDLYNKELWDAVEEGSSSPIKNARSFRFKKLSQTFLLDGTDIMDPMWDSAADFYHPCRYFLRPLAMQVLDLFKDDQ
ncbi:hypothetical protein MHU86_25415 [Fragilaria crotonensis]|nr:hypothetical protein MHU86_25415 [Fragilaria crotonensis]